MVLQYRLPFDVPELGAVAGDIVMIDAILGAVDVVREIDAGDALSLVARLIPSLEPVSTPLHPAAASALVAALRPGGRRGHLRLA